jgi:hypothetical protein
MSHIVEIKTEVRDPTALESACQRLQLPPPQQGTFRLFTETATGLGVNLPDWRYPVVCDIAHGQVRYDNYGGAWGDPTQLDRLLQAYAVEKAKLEARRQGHSVTEQPLADGSIQLTVQVGG